MRRALFTVMLTLFWNSAIKSHDIFISADFSLFKNIDFFPFRSKNFIIKGLRCKSFKAFINPYQVRNLFFKNLL